MDMSSQVSDLRSREAEAIGYDADSKGETPLAPWTQALREGMPQNAVHLRLPRKWACATNSSRPAGPRRG